MFGFKTMSSSKNTDDVDTVKQEDDIDMEDDDEQNENESSDSEDEEDDTEEKIHELEEKIKENPLDYEAYLSLIAYLRKEGELERLRIARKKMHSVFPLTEQLWLEWIEDEMKICADDRAAITDLFDKAVQDYMCVGVWLEYVQFAVGGMGEPNGIQNVRSIFERAITAVGLHVTKGGMIWDAYREFENAILDGLEPEPGSVTTPERLEQIQGQINQLKALFKRQLSLPLRDMENTFQEYKDWCPDELDPNIEQTYKKAEEKLQQLLPYEDALDNSEPPHLAEYQNYIKHEMSQAEPARIQCIYERAIEENCLVPQLWIDYTKYIDTKLKAQTIAVSVYKRSIRNCPWCAELWLGYARALERRGESHDTIKAVFEEALKCSFTQDIEYLLIWTGYCDYMRRRITWNDEHNQELDDLRGIFSRAISHLSVFSSGDPNCTLLQYWARIEAKFCKNMTKARELWNQILENGFINQAASWLEYYNLERSFGDHKHCRKILQRAVNSVTDYPETVFEAYINFEREEGTLEQYDQAVSKCEILQDRLEEKRAKAAEKESNLNLQKSKKKPKKNTKTKSEAKTSKMNEKQQPQMTEKQSQEWQASEDQSAPAPLQALQEMTGDIVVKGQKRKLTDISPVKTDADGFKVPPPPGFKPKMPRLDATEKSPKQTSVAISRPVQPPPGYKGKQPEAPESAEISDKNTPKQNTEADKTSETKMKTEASHANCTVFVSNLDYKVTEEKIKEVFSKIGEVKEVRLVKNYRGLSKGYAYVEFIDEFLAVKALDLDRTEIDGRPVFVSPFEEKGNKTKKFKYSTSLEKNKLFVKGLPFSMSQEALENLFKQHGTLKSVRLVTYRNGYSKGLAYIEYENESDAAQAILKTDQLKIGENTISVAISNPPERKTPLSQREPFLPSLGSGKRETLERGKARTQLSLVPRSLQRAEKPKQTETSKPANGSIHLDGTSAEKGKLSNEDFRNMLLKKL